MFPGSEQYTSVIYDVYDRFVELYGLDAVIPVERTDIGNIGMSAVQFEPELFRCMAMKGAEIICRVATGGFEFDDMRLTSYHNSVYTMMPKLGRTHRRTGFLEDTALAVPGRSADRAPRASRWESWRVREQQLAKFDSEFRTPGITNTYLACTSSDVSISIGTLRSQLYLQYVRRQAGSVPVFSGKVALDQFWCGKVRRLD